MFWHTNSNSQQSSWFQPNVHAPPIFQRLRIDTKLAQQSVAPAITAIVHEDHSTMLQSTSPPLMRDGSPSPSVSPTPATSSCPSPDRTFSSVSSASTFSARSADTRSSTGSSTSRRRGYLRPQGATFAESAKNRESVMSLGSIAHLQYYFARTGLLDGKGGHLARSSSKKSQSETPVPTLTLSQQPQLGSELIESPVDERSLDEPWEEEDPVMLPPTVSTYCHRDHYLPPPPDMKTLKKELQDTLKDTKDALDPQKGFVTNSTTDSDKSDTPDDGAEMQGWWNLQGMHILDVTTLAIRAARIYYTSHECPTRLTTIKSERKIREELLTVLDALKRYAARSFAGGLKPDERKTINKWVCGVEDMLVDEKRLIDLEKKERESWGWVDGDWYGREYERERAFLGCLETSAEPLPPWTPAHEAETLPTLFLERLRDGRALVRYHNEAVKKSEEQFGDIKKYNEDTAKPYRIAENLRFWVKAAELRWGIKLDIDVMGVVYGKSDEVWRRFDDAVKEWCSVVREELTIDWKTQSSEGLPNPLSELPSEFS